MNASENFCNGQRLHQAGNDIDAASEYLKAVLAPDCDPWSKAAALNNVGLILHARGRMDKACQCFVYAMQLNPKSAEIVNNYGSAKMFMGDYPGATECFHKAVLLNPKSVESRVNAAVVCLTTGDLQRGFINYEWRWKWPAFTTKHFDTTRPKWKGQSLEGKTIMLTHEQGLGDSIQFIRYAKMVKARGARVRFLGLQPLQKLFEGVEGIDEFVLASEDEGFDYHCPLLSLPKVFKTTLDTIPNEVPYIKAAAAPVPIGVGRLAVGIVWAGRPEHAKDKWRSITAKHFEPLMDVKGVEWHSLQFGPKASQFSDLPACRDWAGQIKDLTDTAAIIKALDLVICVDTAIAHLAGALAKPVWMLTPFNPDWRWMLDRTDSPWYPTMRLFRQPNLDDWDSVFSEVKTALINKVAVYRPF